MSVVCDKQDEDALIAKYNVLYAPNIGKVTSQYAYMADIETNKIFF